MWKKNTTYRKKVNYIKQQKRKSAKVIYFTTSDGKLYKKPRSDKFNYQILARFKSDADYYLGNGNRNSKDLYYENPKEHIKQMKLIYKRLPKDGKPKWLTSKEIREYEKRMLDPNYQFKKSRNSTSYRNMKYTW